MPLDAYYGGNGAQVMRKMKQRYGAEKGERIFYATLEALKKREQLQTLKQRRKSR